MCVLLCDTQEAQSNTALIFFRLFLLVSSCSLTGGSEYAFIFKERVRQFVKNWLSCRELDDKIDTTLIYDKYGAEANRLLA